MIGFKLKLGFNHSWIPWINKGGAMKTNFEMVDVSQFYWLIGAMIVLNMGTILSIVIYAGKALWWISKLDSRVKLNTRDVNKAHTMIRELREE